VKLLAAVEICYASKSVAIFKIFGYAIIPSYANLKGLRARLRQNKKRVGK
jgi:hypothetical protein